MDVWLRFFHSDPTIKQWLHQQLISAHCAAAKRKNDFYNISWLFARVSFGPVAYVDDEKLTRLKIVDHDKIICLKKR